jgi:signal transduction histidine kinase
MQRKIDITTLLGEIAAEASGAAFIVDVSQGTVVAANDAARFMWADRSGLSTFPLTLDRAMPALAVLSGCTASGRKPRLSDPVGLVFWTPHGVRNIQARCRRLAREGFGDCVLVLFGSPDQQRRADAPAGTSETVPSSRPLAPDAADLATLARIRAAIETGETDQPVACAEPEVMFERARAQAASDGDSKAAASRAPALAQVAHEIRTPLAAIAALADVMRQEHFGRIGNARYREYVADIHDSAQHALDVLNGMLDPSAWESGCPALHPMRAQIKPIVAACLSSMRPLAYASGLRLVGKLAPRLPAVLIDVPSLRQMLLNLIANAIQYAGEGATITVITQRVGNDISVEVRDNGRGMPAEKIARILGPTDQSLPAAGDRRGLGLPFTRLLAEANGARLTLSAQRGRGTRAAIIMPPMTGRTSAAPAKIRRPAPKSPRKSSRRS